MVSCSRSEKLLVFFPQLRQSSTVKGRTWHKLMTSLFPFSNTAKSPCGPLPKNWFRSSVLWPATLEQKKKPNCIMIKICSVKICCRRHYCVISILWQLENVWWTKICFWLVRLSFSSPAISPLKWQILEITAIFWREQQIDLWFINFGLAESIECMYRLNQVSVFESKTHFT